MGGDRGHRFRTLSHLGVAVLVVLAVLGLLAYFFRSPLTPELAQYEYRPTRQLVSFVDAAADELRRRGADCFRDFADTRGRWIDEDLSRYLFIYDTSGTCVFHAAEPELVGQQLSTLQDVNGKHMVRKVIAVGEDPQDPGSDWVHYLWILPGQIMPQWKSSYIVRVTAPDGRQYLIGSGIYNMMVEKKFIRDVVDEAADLVAREGDRAWQRIADPSGNFVFCNSYTLVIDRDGRSLVDPAFPSLAGWRQMLGVRDMDGKPVTREILDRLAKSDRTWVKVKWPRPGMNQPETRLLYARRVAVDSSWVAVVAGLQQPSPIWMRQ